MPLSHRNLRHAVPRVLRVPSYAGGQECEDLAGTARGGSQFAPGSAPGTVRTSHSSMPLSDSGEYGCPVLCANKGASGVLFTHGSSCGLGALRRSSASSRQPTDLRHWICCHTSMVLATTRTMLQL